MPIFFSARRPTSLPRCHPAKGKRGKYAPQGGAHRQRPLNFSLSYRGRCDQHITISSGPRHMQTSSPSLPLCLSHPLRRFHFLVLQYNSPFFSFYFLFFLFFLFFPFILLFLCLLLCLSLFFVFFPSVCSLSRLFSLYGCQIKASSRCLYECTPLSPSLLESHDTRHFTHPKRRPNSRNLSLFPFFHPLFLFVSTFLRLFHFLSPFLGLF